jgi:hypothetical protein
MPSSRSAHRASGAGRIAAQPWTPPAGRGDAYDHLSAIPTVRVHLEYHPRIDPAGDLRTARGIAPLAELSGLRRIEALCPQNSHFQARPGREAYEYVSTVKNASLRLLCRGLSLRHLSWWKTARGVRQATDKEGIGRIKRKPVKDRQIKIRRSRGIIKKAHHHCGRRNYYIARRNSCLYRSIR